MPTWAPRCSASASLTGASRPVEISVPMLAARVSRDPAVEPRDIGAAVKHRAVEIVGGRADAPAFPSWRDGRRRSAPACRRCASRANRSRPSVGTSKRPRPVRLRRVVIPQPVEMGEFGADAAEIVPDAAQDGLDLGGGFLRKRGLQIGAADAVLAAAAGRCGASAQPAKSASRSGLTQPHQLEHADGERADARRRSARLSARRRRRASSRCHALIRM